MIIGHWNNGLKFFVFITSRSLLIIITRVNRIVSSYNMVRIIIPFWDDVKYFNINISNYYNFQEHLPARRYVVLGLPETLMVLVKALINV